MADSSSEKMPDTATAGREAAVKLFVTLRTKLRFVFLSFVVGFGISFVLMRWIVWPQLKARLIIEGAKVVAITPFDVILLQTKISLLCGVLVALGHLLYMARSAFGELDWMPNVNLSRRTRIGLTIGSIILFIAGVAYAYFIIFPLLFRFLQTNAINAGLQPTYSIVDWTEFIVLLAMVMGFAAELPLVMSALTFLNIVQYESFRDKWRHAVLGIVIVAAAANGSPDPFSMMLIAVPLIALYGIGLGCSRIVAEAVDHADGSAQETSDSDDSGDVPEVSSEDSEEDDSEGDVTGIMQERAAGALDAFAEQDIDDDQLGGYVYDFKYIISRLKSQLLYIGAFFLVAAGITFTILYGGGIRILKEDFLSKLPPGVGVDQLDIVLLHPIEVLVFEMKLGFIVAGVLSLPFLLYAVLPVLEERGLTAGNQPGLVKWIVVLSAALAGGSIIGYMLVAPTIISYLVADTLAAGVDIAYRVSDFFWMVFLTTVGIGFLALIPAIMVLLHVDGIVSYQQMRDRWRVPVFAAFVVPALLPQGVVMMLIAGIPLSVAVLIGLALVRVAALATESEAEGT